MNIKVIPERDIIFLSGVVDSEGCILIKTANNCYNLVLEVTMAHKPMVEKFLHILGFGSFNSVKRKQITNQKQAWRYSASGEGAKKIIELILPYMIVKKEEAEMALEFLEFKRQNPKDKSKHYEYYRGLQALKKIEWKIENV